MITVTSVAEAEAAADAGADLLFLDTFTSLPDHGLWARGPDRLYVHRGTGHYGFPLRLGVPAEESVLRVHRMPASS